MARIVMMVSQSRAQAQRVATVLIVIVALALLIAVGFAFSSIYKWVARDFLGSGEVVAVPELAGLSEEDASNALSNLGLVPKIERRLYSDAQPVGCVFKQDPRAGSKTKPGRHVSVWISLGKASFIAPDLIGKNISVIPSELHDAGLVLGTITKVYLPDIADGIVVNQDPLPDREYHTTIPINIIIAANSNLPQVPVPDVIGMRLAGAESAIAHANLHLAKVTYVADDDAMEGAVIEQNIGVGQSATLGSNVELKVALPTDVMNSPVHTINLHIPIPLGPAKQRVKIKVFDKLNRQGSTIFEGESEPGGRVEQHIEVEGKATVFVFLRDMDKPYREDRL